ncbi:MAG TPA: AtpZ/AtpI family protein [Bacteroidia bacterium]|nr:AtpZ/AtpI family protein [Bacteroidia bacterium]
MLIKPDKSNNSKKSPLNTYAKYSVMAFQMAAIIFGFTYAGMKLDEHYHKSPVFTTSLALFSIFLAIWFSIKDFIRKK